MTLEEKRVHGRRKLRDLMIEASNVARKFSHWEYLGEIREILDGLKHDQAVEALNIHKKGASK